MKGHNIILILLSVLLCITLYISYTNFKQIQILRQENTNLWVKIDSVQQICSKQPQKQRTVPTSAPEKNGITFLDYLIKLGEEEAKVAAREKAKQKVIVSSKYRLEDRYVSYKVQEPEFIGDQTGEIVINIFVNNIGDVVSAKLHSVTGITNEEVIEACKKAALKTNFNYNSDIGHNTKQTGTITYTFSAK
ncbi:MAG: hypothetical protein IIU76_02810 [Bacteroidales bacterium]|nr:hypothetical protein [Bacteroidales bacterium]